MIDMTNKYFRLAIAQREYEREEQSIKNCMAKNECRHCRYLEDCTAELEHFRKRVQVLKRL